MATAARVPPTTLPRTPRKLDLACGQRKHEGFVGVDVAGDADIVHDLLRTPWPFRADTVEEVVCSHFVEHIPHYRPEFGGVDGWWVFFNELYRVCKHDAKLTFVHPYAKHERAFWDPTHTRYVHEMTWYYLDVKWREAQGLDHYTAACDFEIHGSGIQGMGLPTDIATRSEDHQQFARQHYWNVIPDLQVELRARKASR
jgi:predicted SAM-dependent methyltransferase